MSSLLNATIKIGKLVRYDQKELESWIERKKIKTTS